MFFPQFPWWIKPLGFSNGWLYKSTHCFNGGWNPRGLLHQQFQRMIFFIPGNQDVVTIQNEFPFVKNEYRSNTHCKRAFLGKPQHVMFNCMGQGCSEIIEQETCLSRCFKLFYYILGANKIHITLLIPSVFCLCWFSKRALRVFPVSEDAFCFVPRRNCVCVTRVVGRKAQHPAQDEVWLKKNMWKKTNKNRTWDHYSPKAPHPSYGNTRPS